MTQTSKRIFLILLLIPCWVIAYKYEIDFVVLHSTAQFVLEDWTRVYANHGEYLGRYFYGPVSLPLIAPFGLISFAVAKWIWIGLQTLAFVLFWIYLNRMYPTLKDKSFSLGWLLIWIVSINPIHNNFQSNNIQLMLAAVLLICELWTRTSNRNLQIAAGFFTMLCATIKIFPAFIAAFYFVAKNKNVRWGLVAGVVFSIVLPFVYFGMDVGTAIFQGFWANVTSYSMDNSMAARGDILCLPSLLERVLPPGATTQWIIRGSVLGISAIFFLFILWKKWRNEEIGTEDWAMAMFLCAFLNPSTRPHYFIFYVPAFCSVLIALHHKREWAVSVVTAASIVLLALTVEWVVGKQLNNRLEILNLPTYGMALIGGVLTYYLLRRKELTTS